MPGDEGDARAAISRRRAADEETATEALFDGLARLPVLDPALPMRSSATAPRDFDTDGRGHVGSRLAPLLREAGKVPLAADGVRKAGMDR